MKVYVVTCGYNYEDSFIFGVYSAKDKAEKAIVKDKESNNEMDWYEIAEWEVK